MKRLKREQTLVFRKTTKDSFKLGIQQGIGELADAALPFYADLKPEGIDKLATKVFTIVDTNALDFMAQYNLTLAGDVHRELADGIKRTILNGVATGKGADDIVRDMGKVIVDKDSFRQAGSRVFSKAQYRMEMIARTEVLRAHNMGRLKFHERVGIQKLEWLAMEDERMCPVCGGLDGKTFPIDKFPQQPAHPHCRCTNIVAWPMTVCGSEMAAKAAAQASQGDACILPPHVLEGMAEAQAKENAKLKSAFENGDIADLGSLTVKQLQTLAKQNGVAIARTKADFIKLLDLAEPGIDHGDLAGAALSAKLKEHKIGLLRTKEELVELLGLKQAELKQAKLLAAQMAKIPPAEGLEGMTAQQLKEMAKENGISLNMTKQETIELLDKLEPGVDHSGLMGKELAAAKQKHGIGILKNKQQLVEALIRLATEETLRKWILRQVKAGS
jgi:SPP1 gp7 family putative phage head morphogenesis protein